MFLRFRSSLFVLLYFSTGAFYGILGVFFIPLPQTWGHRIISSWCSLILILLRLICGIHYQLHGKENIALAKKPFVVLAKHQSTWETLYLQELFHPICTILKIELLRLPFFGWGLRRLNPIAIDRSNPRQALHLIKNEGLKRLADGYNLLIFPEGTRTEVGKQGKYARGGANIAREAEADILPVAHNAGLLWPMGTLLKYPGTIQVIIGKPISTKGRNALSIIHEVEQWIEGEVQKITKV